jgi:hypothetical protein
VTAFFLVLSGFGLLGALCFVCYEAGKSDQRATYFHDLSEMNNEAALIRDRLQHDPDYARSVRDRFSR